MAASGLNLSRKIAPATSSSITKAKVTLVPDVLDSGASKVSSYLKFDGKNCSKGATLLKKQTLAQAQAELQTQLQKAQQAKIQRAESKTNTAGRKWFDMQSHELTSDARKDFALLRMRNYLDPKKFYKVRMIPSLW